MVLIYFIIENIFIIFIRNKNNLYELFYVVTLAKQSKVKQKLL